jgi:hypothetical protein
MNKQPRSLGPLWRIKDGYWAGVAAASPPATELRMFLGEYTAQHYARNYEQPERRKQCVRIVNSGSMVRGCCSPSDDSRMKSEHLTGHKRSKCIGICTYARRCGGAGAGRGQFSFIG